MRILKLCSGVRTIEERASLKAKSRRREDRWISAPGVGVKQTTGTDPNRCFYSRRDRFDYAAARYARLRFLEPIASYRKVFYRRDVTRPLGFTLFRRINR